MVGGKAGGDQESQVRRHLEAGDIVPLAMSLIHLTQDTSVLDKLKPYVRGPWDHQISVPEALASEIRDRLTQALTRAKANANSQAPRPTSDEAMLRMMSVAVGGAVDRAYVPLAREQFFEGLVHAMARRGQSNVAMAPQDFSVLVIGAGASGLCAAARLGQAGIRYIVLEKDDDVGGTWYENRYPGCAVDLPSHFYQYSFEPNDDWPHYYSRQQSVLGYLSHFAKKYGVRENTHFGYEVETAVYHEDKQYWAVLARGRDGSLMRLDADAIICAVGMLNRPAVPRLEGLADFSGQAFHTAQWPAGTDLRGKNVALIGTAASGIQVGPAIADDVASLTIFQRSATWATRRANIHTEVSPSKKWVIRNVPHYRGWYRFLKFWAFGDGLYDALKIDPGWRGGAESISELNAKHRAAMVRYMERELGDRRDLLESVIPKYPPYGKRVLADPGWYKMLLRPHVRLVKTPIERVERDGLRTNDGRFVQADVIIFATGFQAGRMLWPMEIYGQSGRTIREIWGDDNPSAYLGITVPEFPNCFILYGPNSNFGHGGSAIFLAECQVEYVLGLLKAMASKGYRVAKVRKDVHDAYNELIDVKLRGLSWAHSSVNSWYRNSAGRVIANQPWRLVDYWQLTRKPNLSDYEFEERR